MRAPVRVEDLTVEQDRQFHVHVVCIGSAGGQLQGRGVIVKSTVIEKSCTEHTKHSHHVLYLCLEINRLYYMVHIIFHNFHCSSAVLVVYSSL